MRRQHKFQIYLAGACKGLTKEEANRWRGECQNWATWHEDVYMYNPNDYFNYWDRHPLLDEECMKTFLAQLRQSDLVLVNLDQSAHSVGTGIEVAIAHELKIPVIGFTVNGKDVYEWTALMCDMVYNVDIVDMLNHIYKQRVEG